MMDVYLLSGFLGSGKTSLLVQLVEQVKKSGRQPAVLMNEFGELNVDSRIVEDAGEVPLKELLNGCICCTGAESTEAQLQGLLTDYPEIDVLFIETTGAAHPVEALDAVCSPLFADQLDVKGIVTVVDAKRWIDRDKLSPRMLTLFLEQIRHANFLLLNKTDLLTDSQLAFVTMQVTQFNSYAPLIQTVEAKADFSYIEKRVNAAAPKQPVATGSGLPLTSKTLSFDQPINQEHFEDWVRTIPDSVYRMKGYIQLEGSRYSHLFQYAYGMVNWMPEYIQIPSKLVIIGEQLDNIQYVPEN
ncbi:cobalamin biosynthesis protein [Sporosarcina sp. P37]|uniref:CobW family GTP-binding protein n=1 Tax=unclassified Sporosarcina TaxID=2647733 RepID=UPI000A17C8D4|nr:MULTISPECIES: GTP-binding protein [unclassified Sporosarcina]ARK23465.1 cobalamin biosynthesis protein [Sporosarcina sp. P37]PID18676.1 GTP-binding protein [Sporosarcina sp. P35]